MLNDFSSKPYSSGGSSPKSDRGSTLQVWAFWVWWAWLAWRLDLCNDVVKQNAMISIFRKLAKYSIFRELKSFGA